MNTGYRFVTPFTNNNDFEESKKIFSKDDEIKKIIMDGPYEISIIYSMLIRELSRIGNKFYEFKRHNK